jgi:hypothetical protein
MPLPGNPSEQIAFRVQKATGEHYLRAYFGSVPPTDCATTERLRRAHEATVTTWKMVSANHMRRMNDATMTEAARLRSSAQYARTAMAKTEAATREAIAAGEAHLEAIDREVAKHLAPPNSVGTASIHAEIRAYVRGLKDKDRANFLTAADAVVKKAIATAPPALSGVVPAMHQRLKRELLDAEAPALIPAAQRIADGVDQLKRGAEMLQDHAGDLIDFRSAEALEELSAEESA